MPKERIPMYILRTLTFSALLVAVISGHSIAQGQYYTKPLQLQLNKIKAVPATVKDAYAMADKAGSEIRIPRAIAEVIAETQEVNRISQTTGLAGAPGAKVATDEQTKLIQEMQDPAWQKKFEAMSKQEQMAIGMKIQKAMSSGFAPVQAENDAVMGAIEEAGKIMMSVGELSTVRQKESPASIISRYQQKWTAHWDAIDEKALKAIRDLPIIDGSPGKDPARLRSIRLGAIDQKIDLVNRDLKLFSAEWNKTFSFLAKNTTRLDGELKKINYYEQFKSTSFRSQMLGHQVQMALLIGDAASQYGEMVVSIAELQHKRTLLEREPLSIF